MSAFLVARGNCLLGTVRRDADENIVEQTAAKFEPDAEGGCVAICELDPETMEPVSVSEVYGDYQAAHYLARILEKLGPGRPVNFPDFQTILKRAVLNGADDDFFCEYCGLYGSYDCRDCIVTEWKEEIKE